MVGFASLFALMSRTDVSRTLFAENRFGAVAYGRERKDAIVQVHRMLIILVTLG